VPLPDLLLLAFVHAAASAATTTAAASARPFPVQVISTPPGDPIG